MILRSLNEITGEFRKAALGAGFPVGQAEDLAHSASALILMGLDGTQAFLEAINSGYKHLPFRVELNKGGQGTVAGVSSAHIYGFNVASHAIALFEMAQASGPGQKYLLCDLENLTLLIGAARYAAHTYQSEFRLELIGQGNWLVSPAGVLPAIVLESAEVEKSGITVEISFLRPIYETTHQPELSVWGLEINESLWPQIKLLAAKTYVPASEDSRTKGAGAIVDDNQ